jgi:hypothetical protein
MTQPEAHPQRPFIVGVDERPYSPDTATRKYEEVVARQSGGDVPGGGSPTDLISMSAFTKSQPGQLPGMCDQEGNFKRLRAARRRGQTMAKRAKEARTGCGSE